MSLMSRPARSLPTAVGYCAFLGTLMGTFDAAGNVSSDSVSSHRIQTHPEGDVN